MLTTIKTNWKRYAFSSLITFLSGFFICILANWGDLTIDAFQTGAWIGVFFTAIRAGAKVLFEMFVVILTNLKEVRMNKKK